MAANGVSESVLARPWSCDGPPREGLVSARSPHSANDRYLRQADFRQEFGNFRFGSTVTQRSSIRQLRLRADSARTGAASGTTTVRAVAVIPLRARNSPHRPKRKFLSFGRSAAPKRKAADLQWLKNVVIERIPVGAHSENGQSRVAQIAPVAARGVRFHHMPNGDPQTCRHENAPISAHA